jgi:hypothetical protein
MDSDDGSERFIFINTGGGEGKGDTDSSTGT